MPVELRVPEVGESITEVQIGTWLKKSGDRVQKDETVVVIETDKVNVELPAPVAGTLGEIVKADGEAATVGDLIGYVQEAAVGTGPAPRAPAAPLEPAATAAPPTTAAVEPARGAEVRVMPAAQRLLQQHGLEASAVTATGPGGRLLKEDVERYLEGATNAPAAAPSPPLPPVAAPAVPSPAATGNGRLEEVVSMTPMRRRIAERLVHAQQTAALLTTFNEIDMTAVMALRREHKAAFEKRYGVKLGFMSFFVKAAVDALQLVPQVNAEIRDGQILYRNYSDIGIAVGSGKGLVVPVMRSAERLSFAAVELAIGDFARRAQEGRLTLDELQGGTFTISNGGIYGSLLSTPIVNPPQSGILGLHAIQDRPVARDGQVVIRPMMYVALTYDHRLIDGREAVTFLKRIKECLEDPSRMLLEI